MTTPTENAQPALQHPLQTSAQMTYLLAAINDTQAIIRAIDAKLGILMTIFVIPLTKLGIIYSKCIFIVNTTTECNSTVCALLTIAFGISWLFGFTTAFRGLVGIDNPAQHVAVIEKGKLPKGTFYRGALFNELCVCHAIDNYHGLTSIPFEDQFKELPKTLDEIHRELIFEQAKIVYIRHVKIHRMKWAFWSAFSWVVTGGIIWVVYLVLKG